MAPAGVPNRPLGPLEEDEDEDEDEEEEIWRRKDRRICGQ